MAGLGDVLRGLGSVLNPEVMKEVSAEDTQKQALEQHIGLAMLSNQLAANTPEGKMKLEALKNDLGFRDAAGKLDPSAPDYHEQVANAATQFGKPEIAASLFKAQEDRKARLQTASDNLETRKLQMEQNHELVLQRLTDAKQRDEATAAYRQGVLEIQRQNTAIKQQLADMGKPQTNSGPIDLSKVSPADLEAGYRYFSDGTLPPNMGRGMQGSAQATNIRNIAAQISQNLGVAPEDVRANQLAFKGSGTAVTQLLRREAQIGANVKNFDFNADQVLQLSNKVDRTGTPIINGWLNAGRRAVSGDPQISAFDVAVKTTVNEFAQIVGGTTAGATTEGEKQKAEKLLSAAQTPQQIVSVINQMRIESQNRMKSFADQKKQVLSGMRAGAPITPATSAPSAAPGATPPPPAGFKID